MLNYSEVKNRLIHLKGMGGNVFRVVLNLNSLMTRRNLDRITTYLTLFGFRVTFKEINKKLWSDNYYLYAGNKSESVTSTSVSPSNKSIPLHDSVISVVIPVKNAGDDLRNLLSMMRNQKGFKKIEIIVVDSGSTDDSINIANSFGAKIVPISPVEFSHSVSRNIGAKNATGEYILFTVQDALPSSDSWLNRIFTVMLDNEVVAVSCTETPRIDADLFYKALSWSHNKFMEAENQDRIMTKPKIEHHLAYKKNGQLNNIACLISKDVFMKYGFRGDYAEDLDLGLRLIRDGYRLAIMGSTKIAHSHNRPPYYYLKRGYIEHLHYFKLLPNFPIFELDFEQLLSDIRQIYVVLDQMVNFGLHEFEVPTSIKNLSRFVMKRLHGVSEDVCTDAIDLRKNKYMDDEFRAFLESLDIQIIEQHATKVSHSRALSDKMQSYTALILEYMDNSYDTVDYKLIQEFKQAIFRAYAFVCGTQLATSYLTHSDDADHRYKEIDGQLRRQI